MQKKYWKPLVHITTAIMNKMHIIKIENLKTRYKITTTYLDPDIIPELDKLCTKYKLKYKIKPAGLLSTRGRYNSIKEHPFRKELARVQIIFSI